MKRRIVHGIEEAYLEISPRLLAGLASRPEEIIAPALCAQYNAEPRPSSPDIISIEFGNRLSSGRQEVKLRIRRGHYALAQIMRAHPDDLVELLPTNGFIRIHAGFENYLLLPSSIPGYDSSFISPNGQPVQSYHFDQKQSANDLD